MRCLTALDCHRDAPPDRIPCKLYRSSQAWSRRISVLNEVADLVLFRQGDRLQELTILTTGFVTETADEPSGEAATTVHSQVALTGVASALLGIRASAGAGQVPGGKSGWSF